MQFVHVRNFVLAYDDDSFDYYDYTSTNSVYYSTNMQLYDGTLPICSAYDLDTEYTDDFPVLPEANTEFLGENPTSIFISQKFNDHLKIELGIVPQRDLCEEDQKNIGFTSKEIRYIVTALKKPRGYSQLYMYDDNWEICAPMYRVIVSNIQLHRIGGKVVEIKVEFTADSGMGYSPSLDYTTFDIDNGSASASIYLDSYVDGYPIPAKLVMQFPDSRQQGGIEITNEYYDRNGLHKTDTIELNNIDTLYDSSNNSVYMGLEINTKKQLINYMYNTETTGDKQPFPLSNTNLKYLYLYPEDNDIIMNPEDVTINEAAVYYRERINDIEWKNPEPPVINKVIFEETGRGSGQFTMIGENITDETMAEWRIYFDESRYGGFREGHTYWRMDFGSKYNNAYYVSVQIYPAKGEPSRVFVLKNNPVPIVEGIDAVENLTDNCMDFVLDGENLKNTDEVVWYISVDGNESRQVSTGPTLHNAMSITNYNDAVQISVFIMINNHEINDYTVKDERPIIESITPSVVDNKMRFTMSGQYIRETTETTWKVYLNEDPYLEYVDIEGAVLDTDISESTYDSSNYCKIEVDTGYDGGVYEFELKNTRPVVTSVTATVDGDYMDFTMVGENIDSSTESIWFVNLGGTETSYNVTGLSLSNEVLATDFDDAESCRIEIEIGDDFDEIFVIKAPAPVVTNITATRVEKRTGGYAIYYQMTGQNIDWETQSTWDIRYDNQHKYVNVTGLSYTTEDSSDYDSATIVGVQVTIGSYVSQLFTVKSPY